MLGASLGLRSDQAGLGSKLCRMYDGAGSTVEGIAADSPFSSCKDKDIDGYKGSWDQPLSRVTLQLPNGHGLTSLIFVLKNEDGKQVDYKVLQQFKLNLTALPAAVMARCRSVSRLRRSSTSY